MLIAGILWLVVLVLVVRSFPHVRGTTLTGPWCWICIACVMLIFVHAFGDDVSAHRSFALWQTLGATASLCPNIAILGAKRPQSRAWPFVVASLWVVLFLPVIEAQLAGRTIPDTRGLRAWFMWLVAICVLVNYLGTRFVKAAALVSASQCLLIGVMLNCLPSWLRPYGPQLAAMLALAAVLQAVVAAKKTESAQNSIDGLWHRFRDAYGAVWALRVAQRVNQQAQRHDWRGCVEWSGVRGNGDVQHCLTTLLQSFVSPDWVRSAQPSN